MNREHLDPNENRLVELIEYSIRRHEYLIANEYEEELNRYRLYEKPYRDPTTRPING